LSPLGLVFFSSVLELLCVSVQFSFGIFVLKSGLTNQCDITESDALRIVFYCPWLVSRNQTVFIYFFYV